MTGQRLSGVRFPENAGDACLDAIKAGGEAKRFLAGRSVPGEQLRPRRPALEFRDDAGRVTRDGDGLRGGVLPP